MKPKPTALAALALGVLAVACGNRNPLDPGTQLGMFYVSGTLETNDCGANAPGTWGFSVRLSREGATLYWVQGDVPVSGALDANEHTTMTSTGTTKVHDANPQQGLGYCGLTRDDSLDITLASQDTAFTAELTYRYSPSDGSDCSDQLSIAGGPYAALPCTVKYSLQGMRSGK